MMRAVSGEFTTGPWGEVLNWGRCVSVTSADDIDAVHRLIAAPGSDRRAAVFEWQTNTRRRTRHRRTRGFRFGAATVRRHRPSHIVIPPDRHRAAADCPRAALRSDYAASGTNHANVRSDQEARSCAAVDCGALKTLLLATRQDPPHFATRNHEQRAGATTRYRPKQRTA